MKFLKNDGLLILFSGRPAAGKTSIVVRLIKLLEKQYLQKVYFVEFDYWRKKNFKEHAFDEEFLTEMLKQLNHEIKEYILRKQVVIIESGGTTANIKCRNIIVKDIDNVFDIRIECSFLRAFWRDIVRSLRDRSPRMKLLYFQTFIRNIFQKKKIYLAGFNKPLEKISGFYISTEKNSVDQATEKILDNLF